MSFSSEIKQEVAYNGLKDCCQRAQLSALIQLTSSIAISKGQMDLTIKTENPTTARRIMTLCKNRYPDTDIRLEVVQKTNLRKNNIYTLTVLGKTNDILGDLGLYNTKGLLLEHPLYHIIAKDCCARAYLAGAFLAFGSCNSPAKTNYHLEIALMSISHAHFIVKLVSRFGISAKIMKRRNKYVVYVKRADEISDFLRCIGAHESLMKLENARISRDFKNSLTRLDNCEIANEVKSLKATTQQLADMEVIIASPRYEDIEPRLKTVIDLRMKYRDHSLSELAKAYYDNTGEMISKSGLKHRLVKIHDIAEDIKEKEAR